MVRICHVITALETGGAEHQLERMIGAVPGEHHVISLRGVGIVGRRLREAGIPVAALEMSGALAPFTAFRRLRAEIRSRAPDVVQGWMYHGGLAASLAVWPRKTPVLWNIRHSVSDLGTEPRNTRWGIRASEHLSRHPRAIVYNSHTAAAQHEGLGFPAERRVVIPNGFDLDALYPAPSLGQAFRRGAGIPADAPVVGVVARYHPMKDHAGFLHAAARLLRRLPGVHFVLAGPGLDGNNRTLLEVVNAHGLADHVHLLGECTRITDLCNSLDVLCCPSAWGEAFPNAVGEAMACGVPCVATDVGDTARLIGATGTIVEPRNPQALADALYEMLADDEDRATRGEAARARMVEHFGLAGVAASYQALWDSAARGDERVTAAAMQAE